MFSNGSRYMKVREYSVTDADGRAVKLKRRREIMAPAPATTYQVKQGDRLDLLAFKFYRNARKWWLIADANPGVMDPEALLEPGRVLSIPRDQGR